MDPALAVILTSLVAGYVAARLRVLPENAADSFNRFVIYVCLPAVVLRLVPRLTLKAELAVLMVTPWLLLIATVGLVVVAVRAFGWRREVLGALLLCVPLGNTSFLGFPMVGALLGQDSVRLAVLYDQVGSFLILSTYGLVIVARFSGGGEPSLRVVGRRVVTFPPFLALVAALLPVAHPPVVDAVLTRLGDTLVPVAMFAVGLKLELRPPRDRGAFALGLITKMVLSPLSAVALARAFHAPSSVTNVVVLESGMPPMITAGALAVTAGLAPELSAALVAYGVLVSLVTLPVIASLLLR